ncbi:MAG: hypothetical protein RR397_00025 [Odoribacter sp.]
MKLKYILPILLSLLSAACFEDDTTLDTRSIAVISIDTTKLQKEYNIDKNEICLISPDITQTNTALPLTYEWQVNYKFYSDSSTFKYIGKDLGSYKVRLKTSNADGSAFYTFDMHVNSPYEEGIAVLSSDRDGSMQLSFMRKFSAKELAAGAVEKFETHCLKTNNPDYQFAKYPTDIAKRLSQLFISCKEQPTIYAINTKTFELENAISAPEFPDFVPIKMQIPDNSAKSALIYSENGSVYNLASVEGLILAHTMLTSKYGPIRLENFTGWNPVYYLWNTDLHSPCYFDGYNLKDLSKEKTFENHEPIAMFTNTIKDCFTVISRLNDVIYKTTVGNNFYNNVYDDDWNLIETLYDLREQKALIGSTVLTSETPYVSSPQYKELLYAQGNKIYRWYFSDNSFPTTPWATIDLPGAEITTLALSPNEEEFYVGVYQPNVSGLNGHIYILNSDTGSPVHGSPYLNVAYKPIEAMYKVK